MIGSCAAKHVVLAEVRQRKQHYNQATTRARMSIWQAILCGMMLSWTPSLFFLAWVLWREQIGDDI
jgi:hypothetical protein